MTRSSSASSAGTLSGRCFAYIYVLTPVTLSYNLVLQRPLSITYLMLGIVSEVSATLVDTTHKRHPSGGGSNT